MPRLRSAVIGGLLMLASFSAPAAADVQVCLDDQNLCPALPGGTDQTTSDQTTSDQPAADQPALNQTTTDTQTVGPPVSVNPFSVPSTQTAVPQADQPLVISPGTGADKQHLPPGPPNFQIDP